MVVCLTGLGDGSIADIAVHVDNSIGSSGGSITKVTIREQLSISLYCF
jgi:hypothetical protein